MNQLDDTVPVTSRAPFLVLLSALLIVGREKLLRDPGTFWHVVVGRRILETGTLPTVDFLTFTKGGQPWIAQQWLAEVAMALLDRVGGLDALVVATAVALAAVLAGSYRRLRLAGARAPIAAMVVAAAAAGSSYHFHARPSSLTLALAAWSFAWLCDVEAGRRRPMALALLPPVVVLWSNLHGGALAGVVAVVAVTGPRLVASLVGRPLGPPGLRPAFTAAILVSTVLAPLANPYGVRLIEAWSYLVRSSVLPEIIEEHAPPAFGGREWWLLTVLVVVWLGALMGADWRRARVSWLLPAVWAVLGYARLRHAAIFAWLVPIAVAEVLPGSRWAGSRWGRRWLCSPPSTTEPPAAVRALWGPRALPALVLVTALALQGLRLHVPLLGGGWARLAPDWWPVDLVPALRDALARSPDRRVWNEMRLGGFLAYYAPEARLFIDDRCELHRDHGLLAYAAAESDPVRLAALVRGSGAALSFVIAGSRVDRWFASASDWKRIAAGPAAVLYRADVAGTEVPTCGRRASTDRSVLSPSAGPPAARSGWWPRPMAW